MSSSLAAIVMCMVSGAGEKTEPTNFPSGVYGRSGSVMKVRQDGLDVNSDSHSWRKFEEQFLKIKVTADSKFELIETKEIEGRREFVTKAIKLTDLHQAQQVSVFFHSDGKQLTLLRVMVMDLSKSRAELAAQVQKLGGKITRNDWRRDEESFDIDLKGTKVNDEDLTKLGDFKDVASLDLSYTKVSDLGIAYLARNAKLYSLSVNGTSVSDRAVDDLREIPRLNTLGLAQTQVTEEGVARLVRGRSLQLGRAGLGDKAHYRVHQEYRDGDLEYSYLMIGDTYFGRYYAKPRRPVEEPAKDRHREATTYYHREGPVGQVMAKLDAFAARGVLDYPADVRLPASLIGALAPTGTLPAGPLPDRALTAAWSEPAIGVIRLGVGTEAAYGRAFQHVDFYNSTPEIKEFSAPTKAGPAYFGYVQDALARGVRVRILDGDERETFAKRSPQRFYGALFVESTRNELRDINTKLFTKEAVAELVSSLTETGVVCFHTSHRYNDLTPPLVDAAKELGLAWKLGNARGVNHVKDSSLFSSEWLVIARKQEHLGHLTNVKRGGNFEVNWTVPASTGKHLWRDGKPHDLKALAR